MFYEWEGDVVRRWWGCKVDDFGVYSSHVYCCRCFMEASTPFSIVDAVCSVYTREPSSVMWVIRSLSSSAGGSKLPSLVVNSVIGVVPKAEDVSLPFNIA